MSQPDMCTTDLLDVLRAANPKKTAAVFATETLSYGKLVGRLASVAGELIDAPALLLARNPLNALTGWLACYHRGVSCAVIDPVTFAQFRTEIESRLPYRQVLVDTEVDIAPGVKVIDLRSSEEVAWWPSDAKKKNAELVLATSRTTGNLKLARHRYADLLAHHQLWRGVATLEEHDLVACHSRLSNAYVFNVAVLWALWSGRSICFVQEGTGKPHSKTTVSCLPVPHLLHGQRLEKLRLAVSAGQMIHNAEWEWFERVYPAAKLLNKVGATETLTCFLVSEGPTTFWPVAPYACRVVDHSGVEIEGEAGYLELQPFFLPSYCGDQDASHSLRNGAWTRLGDYAVDNGDGTFKFLGRNTVSLDLENALRSVEGVRDCHYCVHESVPALLVEASGMTDAQALAHAKSFGAVIPESRVVVVEQLKREPSGKVLAATVAQALKKPALPTLPAVDHLPDIALAAVKNMWVRQMYFAKAGQREDGHSHPIDHMTLLARGGLTVIVNGIATDFDAGNGGKIIYIKAGVEHTLIAREDATLAFCIHALRGDNETADIIDPDSIPDGVNAVRAGLAAPLICDQTIHGRGGRVPLDVAYR